MEGISDTKLNWFKEQNFEIRIFPEKTVKKFNDPEELKEFIDREMAYWSDFGTILGNFRESKNSLDTAYAASDEPTNQWQANFKQAINRLNNAEQTNTSGSSMILFSTTRAGKKMKALIDEFGHEAGNYFVHYIFRNADARIENEAQLAGALEAYLFTDQGKHLRSTISKNKKAFDELHSELDAFFGECVRAETDRQSQFEKLSNDTEKLQEQAILDFDTQRDSFNETNTEKTVARDQQFNSKLEDWRKKIDELEDLYRQKLQVEEPVAYWEKLKRNHLIWGSIFSVATVAVGLCVVYFLFNILYSWPPQWLEGNTWDLNTIKGTILLLTMTSIGIYLISLGSKFAVSSFHLARDAEERRQLTYVYLALTKKEAITKEEQRIVLQALFSRADTGLLKGEHGPIMPGVDIINKFKN